MTDEKLHDAYAGVDISRIVHDLQWLVNGRLNRVTRRGGMLILEVYARQERRYLLLDPPGFIACARVKPPGEPVTGVSLLVRRHVEHARIKQVGTRFADRVFWLTLEHTDRVYRLVLEYFGNGNIILARWDGEGSPSEEWDDGWRILGVRVAAEYGVRSLKPGRAYRPPPYTPVDYAHPDGWLGGEKRLVTLLARHGLGGKYADHVIRRLEIPVEARWEDLAEDVKGKVREVLAGYAQPVGWMVKDALPWLANHALGEEASVEAFCQLDLPLPEGMMSGVTASGEEKKEGGERQGVRALERQEAYKHELEEKIRLLTRRGEWYYTHYPLAKEIEAFINAYWEAHHTLKGIEKEWPAHFPRIRLVEGKRIILDVQED